MAIRHDSIATKFQSKTVRLLRKSETIAGVILPIGHLMHVEYAAGRTLKLIGELDGQIVRLKNVQPRCVEVVR